MATTANVLNGRIHNEGTAEEGGAPDAPNSAAATASSAAVGSARSAAGSAAHSPNPRHRNEQEQPAASASALAHALAAAASAVPPLPLYPSSAASGLMLQLDSPAFPPRTSLLDLSIDDRHNDSSAMMQMHSPTSSIASAGSTNSSLDLGSFPHTPLSRDVSAAMNIPSQGSEQQQLHHSYSQPELYRMALDLSSASSSPSQQHQLLSAQALRNLQHGLESEEDLPEHERAERRQQRTQQAQQDEALLYDSTDEGAAENDSGRDDGHSNQQDGPSDDPSHHLRSDSLYSMDSIDSSYSTSSSYEPRGVIVGGEDRHRDEHFSPTNEEHAATHARWKAEAREEAQQQQQQQEQQQQQMQKRNEQEQQVESAADTDVPAETSTDETIEESAGTLQKLQQERAHEGSPLLPSSAGAVVVSRKRRLSVLSDESSEADELPELSRWELIGLCLPSAAVMVGWAVGEALLLPYLLSLGVSPTVANFAFLINPIFGLFLQPLFGRWSDHCTWSWGRRRPFLLLFCLGSVFGLLLVVLSAQLSYLLSGGHYVHGSLLQVIFVFVGFALMDLSHDLLLMPARALLNDRLPDEQTDQGNAYFACISSLGSCVGLGLTIVPLELYWPFSLLELPVRATFATATIIIAACNFATLVMSAGIDERQCKGERKEPAPHRATRGRIGVE
jgi:hypothetical protein